ncbi:hypothetical protein SDC9_186567 [bioreactor metagenome]|uniref:Uncharacterized protein n=1 Tax=bioreactor metagenome TaxID=1076179 RepID=A0A645HJ42_9ZZZZ
MALCLPSRNLLVTDLDPLTVAHHQHRSDQGLFGRSRFGNIAHHIGLARTPRGNLSLDHPQRDQQQHRQQANRSHLQEQPSLHLVLLVSMTDGSVATSGEATVKCV